MIVVKGYLIDINDLDDRNFKKNNDLKFLYIRIMSKFGGASKDFFRWFDKEFWFGNLSNWIDMRIKIWFILIIVNLYNGFKYDIELKG